MKKRFMPILMIVLTLPLFYALSIGPVIWVWDAFNLYEYRNLTHSIGLFYKPVIDLQFNEGAAGRIVTSYMGFWVEAGETTEEK